MSAASTSTPPLSLHGGHTDSFTFGLLLWFTMVSYFVLFVFISFLVVILCRSQPTCASALSALPYLHVRTRPDQNH